MANDLSGPVWKIDTAGTVTLAHVHIQHIRWVSPTAAAGHRCIIKDSSGRVIWEDVAAGANYVSADRIEISVPGGFVMDTLGSGILYIKGLG